MVQTLWGSGDTKVYDPLRVLGFMWEKIQRRASIEFKVKEFIISEAVGQRVATPQAEQPTLEGLTFSIESHLIRGKAFNNEEGYAVFCRERGRDFSEEPHWPCWVLLGDFPFPHWQCGVCHLVC